MFARNHRLVVGVAFVGLLLLPIASFGAEGIVEVKNFGEALLFVPQVEAEDMVLTVTGPCSYALRRSLQKDGELLFKLDETTIDGRYRFEVTAIPKIDSSILEVLREARQSGSNAKVDKLCREGALPGDPQIQTAGFTVDRATIVYDPEGQEDVGGTVAKRSSDQDVPNLNKDFVVNDDLIVDGSACIGFDCVNGEVFSFDTIRLKENNLRIKFDDTSTAASFPRNDWQLTANDSANGGTSKFSIDDVTNARTPFTVEANARSHSLYVDDGGRIGNRTSTPSVEFHSIDGDTPTLRLQQDGSSGFEPQTWDVAGNETNFFVRDVTSGSTLPFRIRPGAPSSSIFIDADGDVGLGTASPDAPFDVENNDSFSFFRLTASTASPNTAADMTFTDGGASGAFRINIVDGDAEEFEVDSDGNVTISGEITTSGSCSGGCDRVFSPETTVESIEDHSAFMWENSFLAGVGPTPENGPFNLSKKVGGILNELEKAHIFIDQLNGTIQGQNRALEAQQEQIQALQKRLEELANRE